MADPCDLQTNCPQGYLDKTGFMFIMAKMAMSVLGGSVSFGSPQVVITETFFDVDPLVDTPLGTIVAPADADRVTGWMQNLSAHTLYVSHSPTPVPNEVTEIGPGQTYNFGLGWTTAQPLYVVNNELTTVTSRVVVSTGVLA